MRFEITAFDDHGAALAPVTADATTLRERLRRAAATGERLHIRPRPRTGAPRPARKGNTGHE
ncbi:hypothetical protein [Kitasatospora purpeofusca]|uniref:hypothetical protein n=1 Tax=Kitasatospora purpeofusca TaxID=67352 RepID=UPI002256C2E6|nr:hypothetical protein [Kitasatospora purpeofusca]WSR30843.1 hypothetical protein OG715_07580 [Kitasatospora purpeofusca]WSR36971.1 hypothetical protein OG715_42020 [Kitasatospora purpeofusca]WSR37673.1 hypothetical protein OG196_00350 [Kitasatospora purpeofusca]WSR40216.1 hypothetical protein OG196_14510 [Kitasatospora purpeofusca]